MKFLELYSIVFRKIRNPWTRVVGLDFTVENLPPSLTVKKRDRIMNRV